MQIGDKFMRISQNALKSSLFILCMCFFASAASAQDFDYNSRPALNFKFNEALINLQIDPQNVSLKGSVLYKMQANINGSDTLVLDDPQIKIDSIFSNGRSLRYHSNDGHLYIALTNSAKRGQQYQVK